MAIHPTAIVDPGAELEGEVEVLPYTIIEAGVRIGAGCEIGPHAVIRRGTTIGEGCRISVGVVLGEPPQDRKYRGEESYLRIGKFNQIREYVTLHRATGEGESTVVGDHNMIMAYSHAGHNVRIGNHCSITNCVQISGHCVIEDYAILGGMSGLHQFVTVGTMAMVGGMSRNVRDVPPYCIVEGNPAEVRGLNVIGLERRGLSPEVRAHLRQAFRLIFRSEYNVTDALAAVEEQVPMSPEVRHLCESVRRTAAGNMGRQLAC